ncbi:hypothetical protein J6590_004138 [Homalodisca vitripennis]|nr:hypothetical protein J6590_004138 [Homalodisca vitripennis]
MPAYCGKEHAFGCKVISSFPQNKEKGIPSINGLVILLDTETGRLKMILDAIEITAWRTAAVSAVATKHMHKGEKKVLAILGAGVQGKSHALAMYSIFKFSQVKIWNRTSERAKALCAELGPWAVPFEDREMCVRGADVIVTVTFSTETIVEAKWLKTGAHINDNGPKPTFIYLLASPGIEPVTFRFESLSLAPALRASQWRFEGSQDDHHNHHKFEGLIITDGDFCENGN